MTLGLAARAGDSSPRGSSEGCRTGGHPAGLLARVRAGAAGQRVADAAALLGLVVLGVALDWPVLTGRVTAGLDSLTQFIPWYAFLGERLRAGELPGWNPHTVAGAPFAADPLSGWAYLPAMILFTALPLAAAAGAYLVLHPILAAVGAYVLGRALGLSVGGALLAGAAYGQTGFLAYHNTCCFAFAGVVAWLPFLLLGAELAARADGWRRRVRWWGLSGLALSQIFATWLGQGTYYALLVFASFVTYRVLVIPSLSSTSGPVWRGPVRPAFRRATLAALLLHGGVPVLVGLGLAAAGLLPRIEYNALSSLAGGYAPMELYVGGWSALEWWQLVWPSAWYAGAVTIVLAVAAVRLARAWPWMPYFVGLSVCLLMLTGHGTTPLHRLAELLPGFGRLHPHLPERIATVFYLGAALLAGAAGARIGALPGRGPILLAALVAIVVADGRTGFVAIAKHHGELRNVDTLLTVNLAAYYAPTAAAGFLRERRAGEGPFRFFGYAPVVDGLAYTQRFADPDVVPLGANNRAMTDGLHDVQGYNAVHLARYDAYLRALNGREQNYHNADVFEPGLGSPLLDALNARYVVTPAVMPPGLADPRDLGLGLTTVYEDDEIRVLERPSALPRAWLVHEAREVAPDEGPALLATGAVDLRRTALLEVPPPTLGQPVDGAVESARVVGYAPDRVEIDVVAATDGLLVLSEAYYPAWRATIRESSVPGAGSPASGDERPAPVLVANHALRAVPVSAGQHHVTLRFESFPLRLGVAVSLATAAIVLAAMLVPVRGTRRTE